MNRFLLKIILLAAALTTAYVFFEAPLPKIKHLKKLPILLNQYQATYKRSQFHFNEFSTKTSQLNNSITTNNKISNTALVVLPGSGESDLQLFELAMELNSLPVKTYIFNQLGHGDSSHLLNEHQMNKIHIQKFTQYTGPTERFLESLQKEHSKVLVIAHSLGAHIAIKIAHKRPHLIDKMVLTAPMLGLSHKSFPLNNYYTLLRFLPQQSLPPFFKLFDLGPAQYSRITTSEIRTDLHELIRRTYSGIYRHGVTLGWIYQATRSIQELKKYKQDSLRTPTLILQATMNAVVDLSAQVEYCKKNKKHCQLKKLKQSKHQVFYEKDATRQAALNHITAYFEMPQIKAFPSKSYLK